MIFERVQVALNQIEDASLAGRVEAWDIQQFRSANAHEYSLTDEDKRNSKLEAVIWNDNQIGLVERNQSQPSYRI